MSQRSMLNASANRSFLAVASASALIAFGACRPAHDDGDRTEGAPVAPAFSLSDLGSTWHDQSAASRTLGSLRGHPQVLALVYTNCTSICPMTVAVMQAAEAKAAPSIGFVLVSMDPARDSPTRLAEYAKQHGLSPRWTLLSGDEKDVRELAAVLGIKYRKVSPTEIVHTSTLTILDADGRIIAQYSETDAVDRAIATLQRIAR